MQLLDVILKSGFQNTPFVAVLRQHFGLNCDMKGIGLLGPDATVSSEEVSVHSNRRGLEVFPSQNIELIGSVFPQSDKDADEARVRRHSRSAHDLTLSFELHVHEDADIELP